MELLRIRMRSVSKQYRMGDSIVKALDGVDLRINSGDHVAITGPSGSGKTTLLNIMGALDVPTSGKVFLGEKDLSRLSESRRSQIRLNNIGFVFQQFYLLSALTAFQNVYLPLKESGRGGAVGKRRSRELLEMVGMSERASHLPSQLSGGEQQRTAIARALANDPDIILADEPTGELDSESSGNILGILKELNRDMNKTIVTVTHDQEVARKARKSYRMKDGRLLGP